VPPSETDWALGRPEPLNTKSARARAPLVRFFQRPPLRRCGLLRPALRSGDLMKRLPTSSRGAVLAVSHDLDGLFRRQPCGLVASHYRPWGSPGCVPTADVSADIRHFPQAHDPSELSPPDQVDTVTEPLLARSPNDHSLSWLALFCPARSPKLSRSPEVASTSGISLPEVRCSPAALPLLARPMLPWASLRLWALTHRPRWQYGPAEAFRTLFESQPKLGPSRPQTRRSEPATPAKSSSPNLLAATSTAFAVVIATQGLEAAHTVSRMPPRCRSISLALQPSGAHRCRWAA